MTDQFQTLRSSVAAALLAATGSLLAMQAHATVIYSGVTSIVIPVTTAGIYLNFVTGATGTSSALAGWDVNLWGTGSLFVWANPSADGSVGGAVVGLGSSVTLVDNLPLGTTVGPGSVVGRTSSIETTGATAFVLNSSDNYVGLKFLNEATGATDYGWMRVQVGSAFNNASRTIIGWAYDDSGASINVGAVSAVPELPTAWMAMMGLGAAGLAAARRKAA